MEGMMNKWQIGPVKLANGEEAFIDAINEGQDHYRYTGRVKLHGEWIASGWRANGHLMYAEAGHEFNLAPPPKKTVRVQESWLVVFPRGHAYIFFSEQSAKNEAYEKRAFAIRKIESFEVTEGEGLS
jgi:hypothetical protein